MQGVFVWPLTSLLAPLLRARSLVVLGRALIEGRAWARDRLALVLHYSLWLALPTLWTGFGWALVIYLVIFGGGGLVLSFIFLLGQTGMPLVRDFDDPWSLQILTSRTVRLSPVGRWFWVGLDAQLAHHLFPKISHLRVGRAREPIRAWCLAHGLTPVEQDLWQATRAVARHFVTS